MSYFRLRPLSYPGTKLFFICFALNDPQSFKNVEETWYPELKFNCPDASIVLLGIKTDLIDEKSDDKVPDTKIQTLCQKIGAKYCACSTKSDKNVSDTFSDSIEYVLDKIKIKKRRKSISEVISGVFGK